MNAIVGWGLAVLGTALAWMQYGWRGVLLAVTVVVFWLLLQFSRALRAMRAAGQRPVGTTDSAVMLQARLKRGMPLMKVIPLTGSLGLRLGDGEDPERWRWTDPGGVSVTLELRGGRVEAWRLDRPDQAAADSGAPSASVERSPAGAAGADGTAGTSTAADRGDAGASSR